MTMVQAANYILEKVHTAGLTLHCVTLQADREYTKEEADKVVDELIQQAKSWK